MARRLVLVAVAALAPFIVPASDSAAAAAVSVHKFVGAWTPDSSSGSLLQGNTFSIHETDSVTASQEIGPANQENFGNNCDPQVATNITYFVIYYTWKPGPAPMGGCYSSVTTPHIEFWGRQSEYGELRQEIVGGERVLTGEWDIYDDQQVVHKHPFKAHRPAALFQANAKRKVAIRHSNHFYREIELSGKGFARLKFEPQDGCSDEGVADVDRSSLMRLSVTRVGGPNVVDFYDLTIGVHQPGSGFGCDQGHLALDGFPVTVKQNDPSEKDQCAVGSKGHATLVDSGTDPATVDEFTLAIPACHIDLDLKNGHKSDRVKVAIDVNQNGY